MIFVEAFGWRIDGADDFCAQIGFAADPVVQLALDGIEEEAIDGEIATAGVSDGVAKNDIGGMATIQIIGFGAKGGDLELVIVFEDDDDAEFASNGNGARKEIFDLVRQSGGDDVVILRLAAEEIVTNAAADPIGGEAGLLKALNDLNGGFGHPGPLRKTTNGHESIRITPEAFDVGDAFFDFVDRESGAEFEDLDVAGFDAGFERGEIDVA